MFYQSSSSSHRSRSPSSVAPSRSRVPHPHQESERRQREHPPKATRAREPHPPDQHVVEPTHALFDQPSHLPRNQLPPHLTDRYTVITTQPPVTPDEENIPRAAWASA